MVILFNLKGAQDFGSIFVPLKFYSFRLIKGYTRTNSTHNRVQRDIFNDNLNFSPITRLFHWRSTSPTFKWRLLSLIRPSTLPIPFL